MSKMVSMVSNKQFDDTLTDIGGKCLFSRHDYKFVKDYPFLTSATADNWTELARKFYGLDKGGVYVRFVNPNSERFGSIARVEPSSHQYWDYSSSWSKKPADKDKQAKELASNHRLSGQLRWDGRSNKPDFWNASEQVEFLPGYTGDTVWAYDRERRQRVVQKPAYDKLGREINVGDFCTYILYQFEGTNAAGIYFGNVTKIDPDGGVWCKNVKLTTKSRCDEKRVKDNSLITILTDDLMKQLMLAKLSNA